LEKVLDDEAERDRLVDMSRLSNTLGLHTGLLTGVP